MKEDIEQIKERNRRVETDKAWETSLFRVITITIITYIIANYGVSVSFPYFFLINKTIQGIKLFTRRNSACIPTPRLSVNSAIC